MDVNQLRQAFIGTQSAFEKATKLSASWAFEKKSELSEERNASWEEALSRRRSREELDNVRDFGENDGVLLLHIIPVGSISQNDTLPLETIQSLAVHFRPPHSSGYTSRINLHGIEFFVAGIDCDVRTQVHRNGAIELVHERLIWQENGKRELLGRKICEVLNSTLENLIKGMRAFAALPPLYISMQLLQVNQSILDAGQLNEHWSIDTPKYKKDALKVPDVILTDYPDSEQISEIYQKLTDPLWNAYGREKCSIPYNNQAIVRT